MGFVDAALVVVYLALILGLGAIRARRQGQGAGEYLLAGRTLTMPAFVATLVSTWYGGVLGVGEYSYSYGLSNWLALGGPYYVAGLIFAFVLAGRARASALTTVPERLLRDHGPGVGALGALVVFIGAVPAAYVLMMGVLFQRVFGLSLVVATIAAALLSMLSVGGGGFRSVVRTNIVQFLLMYGGFLVALAYAWRAAGGLGALAELPPAMLTWDGGLGVQAVLVWYVIALQTLVEPTFYQRCFAARSPAVARRGVIVSVLFWVVFDGLTTFTGMFARVLVPDVAQPIEAYPALADGVLPPIVRGIFYVGLIATVMSTVESYLFVAATTLGYDVPALVRAWRRGAASADLSSEHADSLRERTGTRAGLIAATLVATLLALVSESAVALWKGVGSVVTPALLLPLVGGFVPRLRAGSKATGISIVAALLAALGWMGASSLDAASSPFLGIEPIFPALCVSLAVHLAAWAGARRGRAAGGVG